MNKMVFALSWLSADTECLRLEGHLKVLQAESLSAMDGSSCRLLS